MSERAARRWDIMGTGKLDRPSDFAIARFVGTTQPSSPSPSRAASLRICRDARQQEQASCAIHNSGTYRGLGLVFGELLFVAGFALASRKRHVSRLGLRLHRGVARVLLRRLRRRHGVCRGAHHRRTHSGAARLGSKVRRQEAARATRAAPRRRQRAVFVAAGVEQQRLFGRHFVRRLARHRRHVKQLINQLRRLEPAPHREEHRRHASHLVVQERVAAHVERHEPPRGA